ncbi:MAG: UbiA family prenyltransferase [Chitinispirillaceae bacterium]|nr:UbiA family prenyltransferase [Chitinispirillaceae bacterium]
MIASTGTLLGAWISYANLTKKELAILFFVTFNATGFGNVVNDIADIETDKISHPNRPLPSKIISLKIAISYSIFLAITSIVAAFSVAPIFGIGTIIPLFFLVLYSFIFKSIPILGNIIVSLLVPYSLIFPAMGAPEFWRIFIPCLIAFFLNFSREIVKTIQDKEGDKAAGLVTTAVLSLSFLKGIIVIVNLLCLLLMILQYQMGFSGTLYIILVIAIVIPLNLINFYLVLRYKLTKKIDSISLLYKVEMISGIAALAIDNLWFVNR